MFKDLVEYIVASLVDNPEEVDVSEIESENSVVLELRVADNDTGRVIGRNGRVINAIRTILHSQAAKTGKRVTLEVI